MEMKLIGDRKNDIYRYLVVEIPTDDKIDKFIVITNPDNIDEVYSIDIFYKSKTNKSYYINSIRKVPGKYLAYIPKVLALAKSYKTN